MDECRLLVVDRDPESRAIVTQALIDQGYTVGVAADGSDVGKVVSETRPSLALVYVQPPHTDVLAAIEQLRERAPDLPILVFGEGTQASAVAEQVGAIGHAFDPLNLGALVSAVEQICPLVPKQS